MGAVCEDLLSPCVCSMCWETRTLRFGDGGVGRAEHCTSMPCARLCSCPDQSASGFGRGDLDFGRGDDAQVEGSGGDADGGRRLRKVDLEVLCARWVGSIGRHQSVRSCAPKEERQLSDAAAVGDRVVQSQPLIAVRNVIASSHCYRRLLGDADALPEHPHRDLYERIWRGGRLVLQLHAWDEEETIPTSSIPTQRRPVTVSCCSSRWTTSMRPWTVPDGDHRRTAAQSCSTPPRSVAARFRPLRRCDRQG